MSVNNALCWLPSLTCFCRRPQQSSAKTRGVSLREGSCYVINSISNVVFVGLFHFLVAYNLDETCIVNGKAFIERLLSFMQ